MENITSFEIGLKSCELQLEIIVTKLLGNQEGMIQMEHFQKQFLTPLNNAKVLIQKLHILRKGTRSKFSIHHFRGDLR